ncbi:hypothetical protein CK203_000052 [Vitis vinifera]|uniref:Uncharacterized protein n=1 Tax=Vitis vinifera TaxID=29760 RepID=A0A438KRU3_VITVI|nr:hypothetical protein CK203_000052 [Vitis vinifera]
MVSEPREKTLFFWFTRVINSGNPSSDRVSFRSPSSSPKAFQSAISWSAKRDLQLFSNTEPKTHPRAIFLRRPESHTLALRARGPLSGAELFQQARPAPSCTSKPPLVLSEPYFSIFLAFSLRGSSLASSGSSLPWQDLCVPWEGLFFVSSHFLLCLGPDIPSSSSTTVI